MLNSSKITIIIPIYSDLPSLLECIKSIKKFVDLEKHTVLLVNDCGPDVERIENEIKKIIKGLSGFNYSRNNENLGFVKSCNHAVFDLDKTNNDVLILNSDTVVTEGFLDEMISVLYSSKKIAAVSPRTNNATIASIPIRLDEDTSYDAAYSKRIFDGVQTLIPKMTEAPSANGFCMLIRRGVINRYGLFDEVFGKGYGEENDFCLRVKKYGYKSFFANHAFVYHEKSKSFTAKGRKELIKNNSKILRKRYPYLDNLMRKYIYQDISLVDWFAELIGDKKRAKKIAIDLTHMPQEPNSILTEQIETVLNYINKNQEYFKYEYAIMTNPDVDDFFKFKKYGLRVMYAWNNDERFDVGFSPYQVTNTNNVISLHRHCLRIVTCTEQTSLYKIGKKFMKIEENNFDLDIADKLIGAKTDAKEIMMILEKESEAKTKKTNLEKRNKKIKKLYEKLNYFNIN